MTLPTNTGPLPSWRVGQAPVAASPAAGAALQFRPRELLKQLRGYLADAPEGPRRVSVAADVCCSVHVPKMRERSNPCPRIRPVETFGADLAQ